MTTIICVSGPPFHSTMWAHVEKRLNTNGVNTESWSLFGTDTGTFDAELAALVAHVARVEGPVVLVGHGLANPLVIAATIAGNVSGIVLTNGPLSQPGRWTRVVHWVSKTPRPLTMAWLRSSVGLRRLVVNPYVMDRDTTVAVCGPVIEDRHRRRCMARYLASIKWTAPKNGTKVLLCQGDTDPLTCSNHDNFINSFDGWVSADPIPGGRMLHPVERPWELADRVASWTAKSATTTQMS